MKLSRKAILDKTHYGLNVYAFILKQFYPNSTVLSLKGRDCELTFNPFNNDKKTLKVKVENNTAIHQDAQINTFTGNVFDFARLYFKTNDESDLLNVINQELHLKLSNEKEIIDDLAWLDEPDDTWYTDCSFFKAPVRNVFPSKTLRLYQIYNLIQGKAYQKITSKLRQIADIKEARKFKANNFDYVTFSGTFKKRNDKALIKHSRLLTIDFDHIENIQKLKSDLLNDKYFETEMLFISPSGAGLKWIIQIDTEKVSHSDYFKAVANYINHTYGIEVDSSGKDVSRACFLPHDPNAYLHKRHQRL